MSEKNIITPFLKQCFVTTSVCFTVISACGCAMGFPGVLLPQLQRPESSISLTEDQVSWIASVEMMPTFLGNAAVPAMMARAGRRPAHFAVILVTMLSWATVIVASSFETMLIGRILQGLAGGMIMPLRSVLVSECSSPFYRGVFLTTISLAQTFGILLVHFVGSFTSYRMTCVVSMSFVAISLLMTIYTPETPSWLAATQQYDKCRNSFMWLRSREEIPELERMILAGKTLDESTKERTKLKEILVFAKRKEFYKPIVLMSAVFCLANFTNNMLLVVYPMPILSAFMGPEANAAAWLVALDVQSIFFIAVAVYMIHKVKRRTLLFTTGILAAGVQLALAGYVFAKTKGLPFDSIWIAGALINAQMILINIGPLPLCSVIAGEVFPLQFRSYAESISLLSLYMSVFIILKTFPGLTGAVGLHGAYIMYSVVMTLCLVVAWVLLPETRGRTLQEIEDYFKGTPLLDSEADAKETELEDLTEFSHLNRQPDQFKLRNPS